MFRDFKVVENGLICQLCDELIFVGEDAKLNQYTDAGDQHSE